MSSPIRKCSISTPATPRSTSQRPTLTAMMAGMMLPSAAPIVLLYARAARQKSQPAVTAGRIYGIVGGYVLVWALFSVGATGVQRALARSRLLTPMMEPATQTAQAKGLG